MQQLSFILYVIAIAASACSVLGLCAAMLIHKRREAAFVARVVEAATAVFTCYLLFLLGILVQLLVRGAVLHAAVTFLFLISPFVIGKLGDDYRKANLHICVQIGFLTLSLVQLLILSNE